MGCNSVIEKNLKKKLVSAIFGPQFNWLQLSPPPLLLPFLPSFFFLNPLRKILLFLPYNFFGRYLLRIRIKIKRTLRNAILNFSYCLAASSNGRRNLFCPTYGSEIFLEAEVLYTCFFSAFSFCAVVTRDKLGSCPYISRPSSCSSRSNECKYDVECKGDLKCCDDGCGNKICASTSYTPRLVGNIYFKSFYLLSSNEFF